MKKNLLLYLLCILCPAYMYAQVPVIEKIEPLKTYPKDRVLITGSGFNSVSTNLQVWFGPVKGTIITSSEYSIEVEVPPQATFSNIEVHNLSSRLSAKALVKFLPYFSGDTFSAANFTAPVAGVTSFSATEEVWDLCTCDLNDDGKPDIAATKFESGFGTYLDSKDLMVLQNGSTMGNLSFTKFDKTNLPEVDLNFATDNVACGDLNGDGKPELVASRGSGGRNSIIIFRNTSDANIHFAAPANTPPTTLYLTEANHLATRITVRDLNKDGKPELVVTNSFNDIIYIFINQSTGGTLAFNPTPVQMSIKIQATDALTTYEAEIQDFNGDNLPDIAVNRFQSNDLYFFKNQSSGNISFAAPQRISVSSPLNRLAAADLNNDGKLDLVASATLGNHALVLINQSTASSFSFPASIQLTTALGPWGVDVGDIDGDQDPDIVIANRNQAMISIFRHNGNFTIPGFSRSDIATSSATRNVKIGDMDGDGKPDISYTSFTSSTGSVEIIRNRNCHKPQILNIGPINLCPTQTVRLKAIPALNATFTWRNGSTIVKAAGPDNFVDITEGPSSAGSYTVTVTGEGGSCVVQSDPITITSSATGNIPPDPTINSNSPLCTTGSLKLTTATVGSASYKWTGPNGLSSTTAVPELTIAGVTPQHAGIYTLQIIDGPCKSNIANETVEVANLADFTISSNNPANTVCEGGSITLSVSNLANHTYQWKLNGVDVVTGSGGTTATYNMPVAVQGVYTVKITNTTLTCDIVTPGVEVRVFTKPVVDFDASKTNACTGETITFTDKSQFVDSRATVVYSWNFQNGTSSDKNPTNTYNSAGSFTPSLTVSYTGLTCSGSKTGTPITVINTVQPTIAGVASICPGEETLLSVAGTFTNVTWSNGVTGSSTRVNEPKTYSVTTTDQNGCPGKDDHVLAAKPIPVITITSEKNVIGPGETVQLQASGADTYIWLPAESLDNPSIPNPKATPENTTTYTAIGTVTGGCSGQADKTITVDASRILVTIPVAFSPNGDGTNETWVIQGADGYPDCTLNVYDGRGSRIYQKKGYTSDWDGTYQGKQVPNGTYYYVFGCPDKKSLTGHVLVVR